MTVYTDRTVGQLVAEKPARARVFEAHRIDYCCAGKVPLADACRRRGVELETLLRELEACDKESTISTGTDWTKAALTDLADHIVGTHHAYLRTELPRLEAMSTRVADVHGHHAPECREIQSVFLALRLELEDHTRKEEQILFPWIRSMEANPDATPAPASVSQPIACMEAEHDAAGAALEKLRILSNNFTPPEDACNTWRVLYASLEALEHDMHIHIHKENSILFPRAIEMENSRSAQWSERRVPV